MLIVLYDTVGNSKKGDFILSVELKERNPVDKLNTTFHIPFLQGGNSDDVRVLTEVKDLVERNMQVCLPTGKILPEDEVTAKLCQGEFIPFEAVISRQYFKKDGGRYALK